MVFKDTRHPRSFVYVVFALLLSISSAGTSSATVAPPEDGKTRIITGIASYVGSKFHGRTTANGESFDMYAMTAAHRDLPFGTILRVTNVNNGRAVKVRVNDRGPFVGNRVIDLSYRAAEQLGFIKRGLTRVEIEIVETPSG